MHNKIDVASITYDLKERKLLLINTFVSGKKKDVSRSFPKNITIQKNLEINCLEVEEV